MQKRIIRVLMIGFLLLVVGCKKEVTTTVYREKDLLVEVDSLDGQFVNLSVKDGDTRVLFLRFSTDEFKDGISGSASTNGGYIISEPNSESGSIGNFDIVESEKNL